MKPKAKTLQERFGFKDEELATPKHDEMMLWFDKNIDAVIADLFPATWTQNEIEKQIAEITKARTTWLQKIKAGVGLKEEEEKQVRLLVAEVRHWTQQNNQEKRCESTELLDAYLRSIAQGFRDPGPAPPRPACKVSDPRWELPVLSGDYTIGFADYHAKVLTMSAWLDGPWNAPRWELSPQRHNLYFEIKTEIRSLGELMRQINHYRVYIEGQFFVVCPDDRFRPTLESQGIGFVKYTG